MRRPLLLAILLASCSRPAPIPVPTPIPPPVPVPVPTPDPVPTDVKFVEELVEAHNAYRKGRSLPPLVLNPALQAAAETHARDMAKTGLFSHTGSDGSSPFQRMTKAGYSWGSAAENVAYNQGTVSEVMSSWEQSSGHRANILGFYRDMGAACVYSAKGQAYWCTTFGTLER